MLIVILDLSVLNIPPRRPLRVIFIGSVALQEESWSNYCIQSSWAISAKLFSLHVQIESRICCLLFPLLPQNKTGVPGENLCCLVESNWKDFFHNRLK